MSEDSFFLPNSMTIGNVKNCQQQLLALLDRSSQVSIDVVELKQIDSAGVQLLVFFLLEAEKSNIKISWLNSQQVLAEIVERLGFDDYFSFQ